MKIVVLASGSGTLLQSVIDNVDPELVNIAAVGADRECEALQRAERAGIMPFRVDYAPGRTDRGQWNADLTAKIDEYAPDLVVSAGFMRIIGEETVRHFEGKIINTHPALLPAFPGAHAVEDALNYGVCVTGSTVHVVDSGVDTGRSSPSKRWRCVTKTLLKLCMRTSKSGARARGRVAPYCTPRTDNRGTKGQDLVAMTEDKKAIRRALISVYDKTGLEELAKGLHDAGVSIVSTGSTAKKIADAGVPVTEVEQLTGFPEVLEGRVKTLHPRVHAGILADTRKSDHLQQLEDLDVEAFELVVVNLYPFSDTVASGADFDACVEQIDIGIHPWFALRRRTTHQLQSSWILPVTATLSSLPAKVVSAVLSAPSWPSSVPSHGCIRCSGCFLAG